MSSTALLRALATACVLAGFACTADTPPLESPARPDPISTAGGGLHTSPDSSADSRAVTGTVATRPGARPRTVVPVRTVDSESLTNLSALLAGRLPTPDPAEDDEPDLAPAWRHHAEQLDALSARRDALRALGEVEPRQLGDLRSSTAPVVVPFEGASLLLAVDALFPAAERVVLSDHLPPGLLPTPERLAGAALDTDLGALRSRLAAAGLLDTDRRSLDETRASGLDGALALLLVQLEWSGWRIESLDYLRIDAPSGDPAAPALVAVDPEDATASALRLVARRGERVRTLDYLARPAGSTQRADGPLARLLSRLEAPRLLLRDGSYGLHGADATPLRKVLLGRAAAIVQSDGGVPLRFLTSDRWAVTLFGRAEPLPVPLRRFRQPDLEGAYARRAARTESQADSPTGSQVEALPGWRGPLIVARRLQETPAAAEAAASR